MVLHIALRLRSLARAVFRALTALCAASVITACAAGSKEHGVDAEIPPEGRLVTLPGGRIHAIVRGEGPDLVMIHGANTNARDFSFDLIGRMADEFRVIAFDRPGFGYSDDFGEPLSPMAQAAILRRAAEQLDVEHPVVLGHSYGGSVALAWALQAPDAVAGMTLLAPASHPWPGELGLWYQLSASALGQEVILPMVSRLAPRALLDQSLKRVFAPDPVPEGYLDHLGVDLTLRTRQLRINARQVDSLKGYLKDMAPGYSALGMPIEVIHGREDRTVGLEYHAERLADDVESVSLTRVDGMGHLPHHADPELVAETIRRTAQRAGVLESD